MILIFPVAFAIAVAILWRSRGQSGGQGRGCRWFWAWSLVGAALSFSFLTGLSIGLLILPFAFLLLWLVFSLSARWPENVGFFEGIGLLLLVIAYLHHGDRPCPSNGTFQQLAPSSAGESVSCGGLDPHPWLYAGAVIATLAAAIYAVGRRIGDTREP